MPYSANSPMGGNMLKWLLGFMVAALAFAGHAQADSNAPNLFNRNRPIELDAGKSPRMYVVFNHASHASVKCRTCHHEGLPGNRYAACTAEPCHSLQGAANRKPLSVYMAYHAPNMDRSCYGCHKQLAGEYKGFKGCQPCHLTPQGRRLAAKKSN